MSHIPFQTIDWSQVPTTNHPGETGVSVWQTVQFPGLRLRRVSYAAGYLADHCCQKGHFVYCLSGAFQSELSDGTVVELTAGMSYIVSDELSSHRSYSAGGVELLIIDGDFLQLTSLPQ